MYVHAHIYAERYTLVRRKGYISICNTNSYISGEKSVFDGSYEANFGLGRRRFCILGAACAIPATDDE